MEEIAKTAEAYYANLSEKQKKEATDLFKKIDKDRDGKITFDEYEKFITKKKGLETIDSSLEFFKKLDKDKNGSLDFDEFITVNYLYVSGRLGHCDECDVFLDGVYFTCVQCFNGSGDSYDLCCSCYRNKNINHHKDAVFLDNYTFLQGKKQGSTKKSKNGVSEAVAATLAEEITSSVISGLCSQM